MNNKDNITIGRPKVGGAIYFAPAGSTLPTNATTSLPSAYINLGYVTEDAILYEDTGKYSYAMDENLYYIEYSGLKQNL